MRIVSKLFTKEYKARVKNNSVAWLEEQPPQKEDQPVLQQPRSFTPVNANSLAVLHYTRLIVCSHRYLERLSGHGCLNNPSETYRWISEFESNFPLLSDLSISFQIAQYAGSLSPDGCYRSLFQHLTSFSTSQKISSVKVYGPDEDGKARQLLMQYSRHVGTSTTLDTISGLGPCECLGALRDGRTFIRLHPEPYNRLQDIWRIMSFGVLAFQSAGRTMIRFRLSLIGSLTGSRGDDAPEEMRERWTGHMSI